MRWGNVTAISWTTGWQGGEGYRVNKQGLTRDTVDGRNPANQLIGSLSEFIPIIYKVLYILGG